MTDKHPETTPPNMIWTAELDQTISQPPLVFGDTLLLVTQPSGPVVQHNGLQALDLATGEPRWQHAFEYALVSGIRAYRLVAEAQEIAVVATSSSDFLQGEGGLLAFDEAGTIIWRGKSEEQHYSAPVVKDRQVFVVAGGKKLLIISPEANGDDQRSIPLSIAASQSAPVIVGGVAYIPCRGPDLLAVALDGDERWHFQFQGSKQDWLDQTPLVIEEFVYAVSSQGSVFALERETGQMVWQVTVGEGRPLSPPTIHHDSLYVGFAGGVAALDRRNGRTQWTFPTSRPVSAQPLVIHDTLYCTGEDHHLYALDLASGEERWRLELARRIETPPVLAKSALLVVDRGGKVVALERPYVPETAVVQPAADPASREQRAEAYEAADKPLAAAAIWLESGQLERAALLYEIGGSWLEAAQLWQQLDRYGKRAEAFEQHARQMRGDGHLSDEEKALAWEQAARAYAETGQKEARQRCEREMARFRRQPILTIEIEPEGPMEVDAWARVNYTVRNEGFGVARGLNVTVKDDRFEGQSARTQTIVTLQPGREYQHWLDVSPKAYGSSVPMQTLIEYVDKSNCVHKLERTFYLEVAEDKDLPATAPLTPTSVSTGTGSLEILSTIDAPDGRDLYALRNQIVLAFNKDEIVDVLFQLELREDDFDERLSSLVRELIVHLVQNGRLDELITICRERRPNVEW
jgi:outer membrane protein assembly factor BamB